jgi:hypothetical protein
VQTPDGLIHLMASKGKPSMHFAMNEAWILSAETNETGQATDPAGKKIINENEKWPKSKTRLSWSWFKAGNGTPVLQGKETWFYENGIKQYEVTRKNGKKTRHRGMLLAGWLKAVEAGLQKGRRHGVDQLLAQRSQEIRIALAEKLGARADLGLEPGWQSHPEDQFQGRSESVYRLQPWRRLSVF